MKPLHTIQFLFLALSVGIFSCTSSKYASTGNSEYDDMYFNQGDRYPVMTDGTTTTVVRTESNGGVGTGYNSKTMNPDYGLPYEAEAESEYSDDEYYVEDYDDRYLDKAIEDYQRNNSTASRYYGPRYYRNFDDVFWSDPYYYQGTIFDPLYRSYYDFYSPFAYRPYYRPYSYYYNPWGPNIAVSIGFGFGYGSYWGGYNPFYYGGGFGYGYGYYSPYNRYYGSAWCPPSYYGGYNNTVVINNIESANSGAVRYGTRQPRGTDYIVNNSPRTRSVATGSSSQRSIRSSMDNSVRDVTERTINNSQAVQRNQSMNRTRSLEQNDQLDQSRSRFRTHSLDSRSDQGSMQQRNGDIRTPGNRNTRINQSIDRRSNISSSPSRTQDTRQLKPNRTPSSENIRSRSSYSRSSAPSRNYSTSPSRNFSAPSRSTAPSRSSYSTPSRNSSSFSSPSRSSSPSPNRSSSLPSRSSGARSISR